MEIWKMDFFRKNEQNETFGQISKWKIEKMEQWKTIWYHMVP